jgi:NhaA family Na+:H+ antiporter
MKLSLPTEAIPGVVLLLCAAAALALANSPLAAGYEALLKTPMSIGYADHSIVMSTSSWIKNALMCIFFFYAGLELKKELMEGALSDPRQAILPVAGAAGGMVAPALIYLLFAGTGEFKAGWAIPAATDIAFALGVLSLLGSRVPVALKAFLLAVAVVDDLGAILIVAFVYTEGLRADMLIWAAGFTAILVGLNRFGVTSIAAYVLVGLGLWLSMQLSGVNPTIAGVIIAACIPIKAADGTSPLHDVEHGLRPWVLFLIMPVFALANAGVPFADGIVAAATHPVALGIAFGLALGKPLGITALTMLTAKLIKAPPPGKLLEIVGVSCIAGIGFTMSLFIGALAFKDPALAAPIRLGVYAGSIAAAAVGLLILRSALPAAPAATRPQPA